MKRKFIVVLCCIALVALSLTGLSACAKTKVKIGAYFGAGPALRWDKEKEHMEERASELGAEIDARVVRPGETVLTDAEKAELTALSGLTEEIDLVDFKHCKELVDSGISVLILMPRNVNGVEKIVAYATEHKVKVVNYARLILNSPLDMYIGYDCRTIGQNMGLFLSESNDNGNYIILHGDKNDSNASQLKEGLDLGLKDVRDTINVLAEEYVTGWNADNAKAIMRKVLDESGDNVNAIFAANDTLAGACAEVLAERGITNKVFITGMDAELSALKRITKGTQSMTVSLDLRDMARAAVDSANAFATKKTPNINRTVKNGSKTEVNSYLVAGKDITDKNLRREFIDSGLYTEEEIYG